MAHTTLVRQKDLADAFYAFLIKERGFPAGVLRQDFGVIETKTNKPLRPDLVVLDPNRSGFTAVIEFVDNASDLQSQEQRRRLLRYRAALGKVRRAAYLVAPADSGPNEFLIHQVFDEYTAKEIPQAKFPDFKALLMGETAKWKAESDQETDDAVDSFKKWCRILALLVIILLILDIRKIVNLSTQQLALVGLATGLALAPYAAKFKFLGIEWERYHSETQKPKTDQRE